MASVTSSVTSVLAVLLSLSASTARAQSIIHVDDDAPVGGDGTTWSTAYRYLQDALHNAAVGDEIRVAAGNYHPDRDEGGHIVAGSRAATFQLVTGIALYGGYAGLADPEAPNHRDTTLFSSYLSGDLLGDDGPGFENIADNSLHVVTGSGVDASAVIDGFTITGGNADVSPDDRDGGGMVTTNGSPTVTACTFVGNHSSRNGGALYNSSSEATITHCRFIDNYSVVAGGAVANAAFTGTIESCHFEGNESGKCGGLNVGRTAFDLADCTFTGNTGRGLGGAICNDADGMHIARCTFELNDSSRGGALWHAASDSIMEACIFHENRAVDSGGAAYVDRSNPGFIDCEFTGNRGGSGGGAIYFDWPYGTIRLERSIFENNEAELGGAVYLLGPPNSPQVISSCTFFRNHANYGGAVYADGPFDLLATNSGLYSNVAERDGGALYGKDSDIDLFGCVLSGNIADCGGGLSHSSGQIKIVGCTFGGNQARLGGGLHQGATTVRNSIFWGNTSSADHIEAQQIYPQPPSYRSVDHSCIQGLDALYGNYNVGRSPLFVDADGPDDIPGTPDDDFRLLPGSPCIDAGATDAYADDATDVDGDGDLEEPLPLDILGNPRFVDDPCRVDAGFGHATYRDLPIVDIGAIEYVPDSDGDYDEDGIANCEDNCPTIANADQTDCDADGEGDVCALTYCANDAPCDDCNNNGVPDSCDIASGLANDLEDNGRPDSCETVIYVDDNAPPGGAGTSWETAYTHLQDGLSNAESHDVIRVAGGIYRPDQDEAGRVVLGNRYMSFHLVDGVGVFGGFAGLALPGAPNTRDVAGYESRLTGDLNGDDGAGFENTDENSYHVVTGTGTGPATFLDGFTVTGGRADLGADGGGGLFIDRTYGEPFSRPTIREVKFVRNWGVDGGGMFLSYANPRIISCEFVENEARWEGGALHTVGGTIGPVITATSFLGNYSDEFGGAVFINVSNPRFTDCVFEDNAADDSGGAVYIDTSETLFERCAFVSSHARSRGGAIYHVAGAISRVVDCRLVNNSAAVGGAVYARGYLRAAMSRFFGNTAQWGGAIYIDGYGGGHLSNCILSGNHARADGGGVFMARFGHFTVRNSTVTANSAAERVGGFLCEDDARIENSILWGNTHLGPRTEDSQILFTRDSAVAMSTIRANNIEGLATWGGEGNFDSNPLFVDPFGPDGVAGTMDDDLTLRPGSPCVDAGDASAGPQDYVDVDLDADYFEPLIVDASWLPRYVDAPCVPDAFGETSSDDFPAIDVGAHERPDDSHEDPDDDGWSNCYDNCPVHANANQADCDGDGIGDACVIQDCHADTGCLDCDENGVPDVCDIASGPSVRDCNGNLLLDECQPGDVDGNRAVDLVDVASIPGCMTDPCSDPTCTLGAPAASCCSILDFDSDGSVDLLDVAALFRAFAN